MHIGFKQTLLVVGIIIFYSLLYHFFTDDHDWYHKQQGQNAEIDYIDKLYFSATTFSTIGFGDITPRTVKCELLTLSQILILIMFLNTRFM